ncbi:MAG: GNAT family N-acetyltransferase [Treponema sp.]|nr:GNAT family N-acetyltransferase [Treponema sp.]
MKPHETFAAEALLKSRERWCMNACHRYINRKSLKGDVWALHDQTGELSALLVHARQGLLPVRGEQGRLTTPHFLRGLFGTVPVHSLQGIKDDVLIMEAEMEKMGLPATEKIDFDLMCMDGRPSGFSFAGPTRLVVRKPQLADMDSLVALHAAYETEEVQSRPNPAVSRLHMERIFANEQMLVAELGGRLIGKINTNAVTFTRCQVGGVYVHPDYRGLGIARRMAGEFAAGLVAQGRGISLFVKKTNPAARMVYRNVGFEILGDYRINYYKRG